MGFFKKVLGAAAVAGLALSLGSCGEKANEMKVNVPSVKCAEVDEKIQKVEDIRNSDGAYNGQRRVTFFAAIDDLKETAEDKTSDGSITVNQYNTVITYTMDATKQYALKDIQYGIDVVYGGDGYVATNEYDATTDSNGNVQLKNNGYDSSVTNQQEVYIKSFLADGGLDRIVKITSGTYFEISNTRNKHWVNFNNKDKIKQVNTSKKYGTEISNWVCGYFKDGYSVEYVNEKATGYFVYNTSDPANNYVNVALDDDTIASVNSVDKENGNTHVVMYQSHVITSTELKEVEKQFLQDIEYCDKNCTAFGNKSIYELVPDFKNFFIEEFNPNKTNTNENGR